MVTALCTFFTKGWAYSVQSWAEHAATAVRGEQGHLILATDDSKECTALVEKISPKLPGHILHHLRLPGVDDAQQAYQDEAQLIIARLQQAAFARAGKWGRGSAGAWKAMCSSRPMR